MKHFLLAFIVFCLSQSVVGQQIRGKLIDPGGSPLVGASISVVGSGLGTSTNGLGVFQLEGITAEQELRISSIGFETQRIKAAELMNQDRTEIILKEDFHQLPEVIVERETLTGGLSGVGSVPGSAHYLNLRALGKFNYTDANRILRNVPGLNIQEEDGFGLRPNIGMRGTGVERSSKITLMEDGILMAPAPYTAPSAYYFPSIGRMQGVEVRKGSSQIKYGPYTTGGAINFISTAIPTDFSSKILLSGGNFGRRTAHAMIGQSFEHGGFMLETFQNSAEGFKVLDNKGPTGFNNLDYLAKVKIKSSSEAKVYQSLTFKAGQSKGDADETYLGLTRSDFELTPFRRYSASQLDNIQTDHKQYSVKYNVLPFKFMDISLTGYQNNFERNWYKLDKLKYGSGSKISISNILDDPSLYTNEYALLTGATSPNPDALFVKANNRSYYSKGLQLVTGFNFSSTVISHDIEAGLRVHRDEEDRFQWEDVYQMNTGNMMSTTPGTPGTESNRVTEANAVAAYIQYVLGINHWRIMPGIRLEDVRLARSDYGKTDPARSGVALVQSSNHTKAWIPGASVEYTFNRNLIAFAGAHKGFAPPGPAEGALPESSINYETGLRLTQSGLLLQVIGFYNDYQNLLGADLAASGGGGTGDLFNAGKASIYGTETELTYHLPIVFKGAAFPVTLAYTYTSGEFLSSFKAENEDWGMVSKGDRLPYLANHQLTMNMGIEHRLFDAQLSTKYLSAMRTAPGRGEIAATEKINQSFVVDISTNWRINQNLTAFGSVNNLGDALYVVAHRPAGLRPGMPRSFVLGLKMNL